EHPFATDFSGYAFNSRTLTPIKHNTILREAGLACKHARKGTKSAPGQVEGFAKARAETRMGSYKSNRDNREQVRSVGGRGTSAKCREWVSGFRCQFWGRSWSVQSRAKLSRADRRAASRVDSRRRRPAARSQLGPEVLPPARREIVHGHRAGFEHFQPVRL